MGLEKRGLGGVYQRPKYGLGNRARGVAGAHTTGKQARRTAKRRNPLRCAPAERGTDVVNHGGLGVV